MREDKIVRCHDCGLDFTWTVGEQDFYLEKGFGSSPPKRCPGCRMEMRRKRRVAEQLGERREEVRHG